jgi:beta-galactosidase beta subunit
MTIKQTTPYAENCRLNAYWTGWLNTEGTGFYTCKECHKTKSLQNHTATVHKERECLGDRTNVG